MIVKYNSNFAIIYVSLFINVANDYIVRRQEGHKVVLL